jgi:hypothetical protein
MVAAVAAFDCFPNVPNCWRRRDECVAACVWRTLAASPYGIVNNAHLNLPSFTVPATVAGRDPVRRLHANKTRTTGEPFAMNK